MSDPRQEDTAAGERRTDAVLPDQVRVHPLARITLWVVGIGLTLYFFDTSKFVFLLLLGAATIAAMLAPLTRKLPWRRSIAGTVVGVGFIVVVLGLLSLLGWLLKQPIQQQLSQWPQIRQNITNTLQSWLNSLGIKATFDFQQIQDQAVAWFSGQSGSLIQNIISSLGGILVALALLGFGQLFLLAGRSDKLLEGLISLLPGRERAVRGAVADLELRYRWWLFGTLISMTIIGVAEGIGFWLIGLKFALPLAVLGGLGELVPTFGPAAVFLLAVLIAATQGTSTVIGVICLWVVIQIIESYVVLPLVMKGAVNLLPLVTLFTVVLWAGILGPLGLLLALPLDLTVWTLIDHFYLRQQRPRAGAPPA